MLTAHQIFEVKHHTDPKQKRIYESFKEKIINDPQRKHILDCFSCTTTNLLPLMEVYVNDILSSNEFNYMINMFGNISNECIQAFIDGMSLDEADWAVTISKGCISTLEKTFYLVTHGYRKEQIVMFAEECNILQKQEDDWGWCTRNLYDVVTNYPDISVEEIKCCAMLIMQNRIVYSNRTLFSKLLKMKIDTSELESFFTNVDTWSYKDEEIIDAFLDFKLLYNN